MEIYVGTIDMSFGNFSFQSKHDGLNKLKRTCKNNIVIDF